MSLSQDILIFKNSITSWNENIQDLVPIDPNTLPPTPPLIPHLRSDMAPWDDTPAVEEQSGWNTMLDTSDDAAIAANIQAAEYTGPTRFDGDGERQDKSSRKPREYEPEPEPTMSSDEAWSAIVSADQEQDLDDFKVFFLEYVRNNKTLTFAQLERKFREQGLGVYLIAMEKEIPQQKTIRNLQGETGKKYLVSFQLGPKNRRTRATKGQIASTPEENLERLGNAGFLVEDLIPVCFNCGVKGHGSRECDQPIEERQRTSPLVSCINCSEEGHRMRDCPKERTEYRTDITCRNCEQPGHISRDCPTKGPSGCRNCGEDGHHSKDCTNPPNPELMTCRNCNGIGHMKIDCPEPPKFTCRNCDQEGHRSSECPEPPNMDKIQCKECENMGHFARDCPDKKCRNCEKPGHPARECPEPRNPKNVECRNCFQMGHFSRDCPEPRTDTGRVCYNCKSPDHMSRECTQPRQNNHDGGSHERRTERDTLSGNRVTTFEPLPSWEPVVAPETETFGGVGGW